MRRVVSGQPGQDPVRRSRRAGGRHVGAVVLLLAAAACTTPSDGGSGAAPAPPAPPTPTGPPAAAPPAVSSAAGLGVDFLMPDLRGLDLQEAQNEVQDLDVFFTRSHDLLGARQQVVDGNWQVCTQDPAPGTRVTGVAEGLIDFGVVKRDEVCPGS